MARGKIKCTIINITSNNKKNNNTISSFINNNNNYKKDGGKYNNSLSNRVRDLFYFICFIYKTIFFKKKQLIPNFLFETKSQLLN